MMTKIQTNKEILREAQAKIIARGENPYYPLEQHLEDMDLIADLTKLIKKYKDSGERRNDKRTEKVG